ncbi:fibronectin isoform X2 [Strongylocentrotus purpuratus]|uniref:Fibronectin type-III domain-containing protein n=1 Tax=Strongylocentrotus purpuratus TaxID=7668 RepID=A0A7M7NYE0_STRPU|nr:fibronectin isoform X2 [Strongylocentrotus purpuratus]
MVRSETFISVAYTLPEDQPSSNQQIRLGHFGSTLQIFGSQPANNIGNIIFDSFPAVSPGDLLYASNAPSSDPTNYLNEIHFRYPSSPPQNVMVNPSPGDAFEVTFDLPATGGNYDGFKIRVNDEVRETLMGSATTSVIINSLAPNTLYTFNVTSFVGIGGDEAESEIFTDTRILGSSMPDITVLNTTESSIALGLQPGHGVLDEYIITIQCMDATQDHCVCEEEHRVPGNAKTFVIDDLRPNVEYGISVVAWAGSELAETSEEVTLEQRTLSIPNNRFTVLDQTPDSVILAWTVSGPANITMERLMPSGYVLNATYVYDGCFSSNVLEVSGLEPVTIYRFTMPDDVSILIRTDPPSIESCSVETTSSGYTFTWSALAPGSNDGYQVTVTDSQGGLVQEEAVPPTDNPEVVKIRVPPETELTLAVISRLAADDTNNFPQQFGAVPCIQNAVTKSLVAGEVSPTNVTVNEIPFVVGNASALEGFEAYAFAVEPPGPVISFNEDSLTGVYSNVIPGQLYTITSTIVGTDVTFTLKERAKPLPPVDGSSPSAGVTSVRLQWGTPSGIVTFYRVTINPTLDTDQNFIEVTNLLPGTDYNVSIVAISGTGLYQQISDPIEFQVITDILTTGELVFVDVTSSSMTAIWPDSGSPPYELFIMIGTETNILSAPSPDGNMLIVTEGVKSSQIYVFTIYDSTFAFVVANNSVRTNPETPQPPILTSVGPFSLSFEWAPTNTTFSSYRMYYAPFSFRRELVSTIPSNSLDLTYSQGCLRPNTEYVFEVETVLDAADGFGEQTSDSAQSISITTGQYDNNEPHVSSTNSTNLQVIWLHAATNGQQVCLKELCSTLRGDLPMCLPTNQTCPLFYTFEGLVPGRRYVVFVEYNDGTMEDVIFTQTKPNPPESLSATALGSDEIRVLLSPPQGEFDGYELSFSPNSAGGPILLEPDTREHLLYNLQSYTTYNIQVFAYSGSNGQLLKGDVISTTATTDKEILSATNIETNQIFVLWSTETEMLDVDFFQMFRLSYSSMVSDSILIPKNAMSTSIGYGHSVTDLVPGDLVTFNLETVTSSGQATLVDTIVRRTKPEMVAMYQVQTDSSTSIRLLWRAPSVGLYRGYLVSYSPADGDQSSPIELGPDEEQLTITGLQFNQMYNVSIRSIMGQEGTYVESDPAFEMVTTGEGEENEVNIRDLTSTSVSFTWWGTGSVESPIGLMPIGSCMAEEPPEQEVTSRAATFDDLMPGARYAISGIGGDNAEFIAVPDQVSNIVVKFINSSAVTFSWTAPSGCYDRIEISYAPDTCTNPSPIVLNHDEGNEYTLTLLQANEEYQLSFVTLQMTARSEPYVASVRTTCPEKEKLNVGSVQADSISLTWGNTTQATATGFTLVATPESSTPIIRELDLSVLEYTFDGLMSGVEYTVVLYVNGTAITDSVTQTTCPSEAQNVTVIFSTQTCLTFAWLPPEGNFHSYEVFVRHGNPPVFVLERTVYPDDDLNVLVENLDASTLYTIGVVTVVDGFKGMPALAIQRTTDNLVMTSTVAGDSQAVTVSWQRPDGADYFNLVYIPDNGDMANSDLTNLTDLSVTIGSLTPGKRYVFILSVHDMDGQSALLAQTSYTLRPERPLILDVMSSVTIAAMAVTAQEGVYETYKISISPSGRTFQGDRAALIFQYISGLEPDTDYIATVTFKTGDEEAEADYEFETIPEPVLFFEVKEIIDNNVTFVWSGPSSDFEGYGLAIAPPINSFTSSLDEKEITIQVNTNKEFLASIYTYAGPWSSEPSTLNVIIDPREPGTIDVEDLTSTSISITWIEIAGITDYIVNLTLASNNTELFSGVIRSSRKASFSGLMPGEEYIIKIGLQCAGEVLSLRQFTLPLEPVCVVFTWVTEDSVTLQWSRPESQLFGYEIMYDDGSGPYSPINVFDRNSLQLERTIMGLMDGSGVEVNITTLAGTGIAQTRSNSVKISPNPREPGTINVEEVTSTSISITWTEIAGITDYIVNLNLASNNTELFSGVIRNSLKASFSGLMPGEEYIIEIELQCAGEVLSLRQFTLPLAPVRVVFTWVTIDSVTLQWSRPESKLVGYEIMYDDGSGPYSPINVFDRISLQLERTIMGLMDGPGVEVNITTLAGAGMAQTRSNSVKISPIPTTTSSPTVSSPPKSTSAGGPSISIVVGSAVGAILVIVVVIVLIIILYKRRSNESATSKSEGRESESSPQYENPVFDQSQTDPHTYQDLNTITHTYQDCNNDDQSYDDTVDPHTYHKPDQEDNYEEVNDAKEKNYVNDTMIKQNKELLG